MDLFLAHFSFSELFCGGLFSHLVENRCMNTYVPVFNFSGRTFFQTTKSSYEKIEAPHLLSRIAKFLSIGYYFYWRTFLLPIFLYQFQNFLFGCMHIKKSNICRKKNCILRGSHFYDRQYLHMHNVFSLQLGAGKFF